MTVSPSPCGWARTGHRRFVIANKFHDTVPSGQTSTVGISIMCSGADHPVKAWLERWANGRDDASIASEVEDLAGGEFLFLVSCGEPVPASVRERYAYCLVLHASDLPRDRGWSPHVWAILEGANELCVTLLDAADPVDSGAIWHQERISLDGTETFEEINAQLFATELRLIDWALANCARTTPRPQFGLTSYRPRRSPPDSQVSPDQTIADIFDLLRVCDPGRFPAHFEHRGQRYELVMRKAGPPASTAG